MQPPTAYPRMAPPKRKRTSPYEYLAVALFLAIVGAILFPIFAASRGGPLKSPCLSHLKQLGFGFMMYAADANDQLPASLKWMDTLKPYLKTEELFSCPNVPLGTYGYAMNYQANRIQIPSDEKAATHKLVFDADVSIRSGVCGESMMPRNGRHNGINSACFIDGHAKGIRAPGANQN